MTNPDSIRVALAGDVMIGRGVDQIMRHPGDPTLHETWARSALRYVELAEQKSGSLPRHVDPDYVWGDAAHRLDKLGVDIRVVNLETAVTARGRPWPGKGIHYRTHPENAECLVAGGVDIAVIANNHILDWSEPGLEDTLDTLDELGIQKAGAGRRLSDAWRPAAFGTGRSERVIALSICSPSRGVDLAWEAGPDRPGVALAQTMSESSVQAVAGALDESRRSGDVVVVSIHWGPNWGYHIPTLHRRFARDLIDHAGVDIVHGHSSHHPLGFEVYRDRLILYGCGDLLTDYEGIPGHEQYRPELGAWYVATLDSRTGTLEDLKVLPTKVHRFQLTTPSHEETEWLASRFQEQSLTPGVQVLSREDLVTVEW